MTTRTRTHTRRKKWSNNVTENSHAMDLESGVFTKKTPRGIAQSLKRSAEHSHTRKSDPFRSAMSMLTFYINRAGKKLPADEAEKLTQAKSELRKLFGRDQAGA
ncbi:MAG TPA: DUF3175 domain-containing protein [Spongiibacteraceae bacterium]|jgi:hypothetical protein